MTPRNARPNRQEVRASIIQTARDIAATDGWSAVTVRKVAGRIGYTAPIIYEHFGSKDDMLDQILKEGYESLHASIVAAVEKEKSSDDRVRAMVMVYWDFSHQTPELYQLMYGMETARGTSGKARDYAAPMAKYVAEELMRGNPHITAQNVAVVMVEAWSMVHGMVSLDISGYTKRYTDSRGLPEALVADVLYLLGRRQASAMV